MNVFWLNLTATTHVIADLKSIIDSMAASYGTRFGPQMSNAFSLTGAKASWLYAAGNSLEYIGTYATPGSIANAAISDSAAGVINWSISDYYRGGHPRTYLPGIPANHMASGRLLDNTERTNIATAAAGFLTDCNALTHGGISAAVLGTVRFASGNAWLSPPVFRAYQSASVRQILGTQRRRYAA